MQMKKNAAQILLIQKFSDRITLVLLENKALTKTNVTFFQCDHNGRVLKNL